MMREKTQARMRIPRLACRSCGATESSCESKSYLSGRDCCDCCDHDDNPTENTNQKEDKQQDGDPT
jgi:hypothetical protein